MIPGEVPPLVQLAREALPAAVDFWQALARDDDRAAFELLSSEWESEDRIPGFTAAYRAARELAPETCATMGTHTEAELLSSDRIRLFHQPTSEILRTPAGEPLTVWRLELVREGDRWLVGRTTELQALQRFSWAPTDVVAPPKRLPN